MVFPFESQWIGGQQCAKTTHGIDYNYSTLGIMFLLRRTGDASDSSAIPGTGNELVRLSGQKDATTYAASRSCLR